MTLKKRGELKVFCNSRGQLALFMIFAIIVIIGGMLYFFYQKQSAEKEVEIVQPEVIPVKQYVEDCIKSAAEDGLEKIGLSGGYISIPSNIDKDTRAYLTTYPLAGFKIPYWRHDGINAIPSEEFIKSQLRQHIANEFKWCINNFENFANIFAIREMKNAVFDVKFNDEDVHVSLNYPIEITAKSGNFKATMENFAYTVPIRFKKVYQLAKLIMERENKDYFLEKKTIDLLSMDAEIPITDFEVRCSAKTWFLSDIKNKLKTLLRVNLPYIRIKGTDYNPSLYVPTPDGKDIYSESYYNYHYIWEIDKNPQYRNMKVSFSYENWPLSIYARPSENSILKSNAQKGANVLSFFCMHVWHFTYDINYPVIVTVIDQETNKNKRYQFNFAFKVAVDHNQPNRQTTSTALFDVIDDVSSEEFCNDVRNEITIFTVDNATGEDIRDVNLTFVCGRFYCNIGKTDWLSLGAAAGITKRLPYCVNGIIKGTKNGYADSQSFIQTDSDKSYIMLLNPVKEFQNYRVVKHLLSSPSIAQELEPNEKATIIISSNESGYSSFAVYPKETEYALAIPEGKDAVYDVSIYLADGENIIGGYLTQWKVGKDALKGAEEIVFHAVWQESATEDERFLFISGIESYSKNVPAPELK